MSALREILWRQRSFKLFLFIFFIRIKDTDITKEEYIEFRSKQFESEKVVDKITEDEEIRAKQEVNFFSFLWVKIKKSLNRRMIS